MCTLSVERNTQDPRSITQQFPQTYLNSDIQMNIIKEQLQNMTLLQVMGFLAHALWLHRLEIKK